MSTRIALGVDIGSVTIKFVLLTVDGEVVYHAYERTDAAPLDALVAGLERVHRAVPDGGEISAVGTTGSGRCLAGAFLGADVIKNEITSHAMGTLQFHPDVRTIIEIGGQDSKIIHLRDGLVHDFAMNTVCAAGTGAFLDQQAQRMRVPIEEFGAFALQADRAARIAGRCSVFAESDMIAKQQVGWEKPSLCLGLCEALVRNYLCNVAKGRSLAGPVAFQGGVSNNTAILHCLREALGEVEIIVPRHSEVCGAIGAALLALESVTDGPTRFRGWQSGQFGIASEPCGRCQEDCDLFLLKQQGRIVATWGGRCSRGDRHAATAVDQPVGG